MRNTKKKLIISEKYSRLPTSTSHSRRRNLQSRGRERTQSRDGGSRPNTANMISSMNMNSEVTGEFGDIIVPLVGTSQIRNKKVFSDCLDSKEILTFKPSRYLTRTKKPNYHF